MSAIFDLNVVFDTAEFRPMVITAKNHKLDSSEIFSVYGSSYAFAVLDSTTYTIVGDPTKQMSMNAIGQITLVDKAGIVHAYCIDKCTWHREESLKLTTFWFKVEPLGNNQNVVY